MPFSSLSHRAKFHPFFPFRQLDMSDTDLSIVSRSSTESSSSSPSHAPFVNERIARGPPPVAHKKNFQRIWIRWWRCYRSKHGKPGKLCLRCQNIDWPEICRLANDVSYTQCRLFELKAQWHGQDFACDLCQLMYDTYDVDENDLVASPMSSLFHIHAKRGSKNDAESRVTSGTVLTTPGLLGPPWVALGILLPHSTRERYVPRLIDQRSIDYDIIRTWIQHCSENHFQSNCVATRTENLQGFKVIDCRSKTIVPAPSNCVYVALSYVWGKQQLGSYRNKFPRTIKDSITVCLALGYDYLWVDRYCINQNSADEQHSQIAKMDQIYSEASLTIISAAGNGSNCGLPGVGKRSRYAQRRVKIGECTILQVYPTVHVGLPSSRWASRAWTYQEAFLSKRKLIFGNWQAWFVCGKSCMVETFTDEVPLSLPILSDYFSTASTIEPQNVLNAAMNCVNEYSTRHMTYDSDSLNACLGVLRSFITKGQPAILGHLWGTLISDATNPEMHLAWHHPRPARRRPNFPSWSWTGWKGKVSHLWALWNCEELRFGVCLDDQVTVSIGEYVNSGLLASQLGDPDAPRILRLTGYPIRFRIMPRGASIVQAILTAETSPGQGCAFFAICQTSTDIYRFCNVYLDSEMTVEELNCCMVMLVNFYRGIYIILRPSGEIFQRAGLISGWGYGAKQFCYENGRKAFDEKNKEEIRDHIRISGSRWIDSLTARTIFVE